MPAALSQTESAAFAVLRSFLLSILPDGIEVVHGQDNLVAEPLGPDFVVLTPTLRGRLSTNVSTYQDVPGNGTRRALAATQLTIQVDAHGLNGAETIQLVVTLLRDPAACDAFRTAGLDAQPLYAGDPHQTPFLNGEGLVETRWTADAVLQVNAAATVKQEFAAQIGARVASVREVGAADAAVPPSQGAIRVASSVVSAPGGVASTGSFATTITGDGIKSSFTVTHGLGVQDIIVQVRDPADGMNEVPGVDTAAPTPDTATVTFGAPLADGQQLRVVILKG